MKRITLSLVVGLVCITGAAAIDSPQGQKLLEEADKNTDKRDVSPVRRIERRQPGSTIETPQPGARNIDGSGNNLGTTEMNAVGSQLRRYLQAAYVDGIAAMGAESRPGPREISNAVHTQTASIPNSRRASDFFWQWGQFLDHDIDLTDGIDPPEERPIHIPTGDLWFDPNASGTQIMSFNRSIYDQETGADVVSPRQQVNEITGWIDASSVYGSDAERASALRTGDGSGMLLTSDGNLLPFNTGGLPNAGGNSSSLFLAGDSRANEQVGLTAMHTLFVREHNRLAREFAQLHPEWSGDQIYQAARRIVGAQMQVITYREFLPLLLGPDALPAYQGYDSSVDARIMNSFSTAAYRLGHSLLSPSIARLNADGSTLAAGNLPLRSAFFAPGEIIEYGIAPLFRGLASQTCQELDVQVVDDVRNFLFGAPGQGGFDLASLNIQRGRDHGLPTYNDAREQMGLARVGSFAQISSDPKIQERLAEVYTSVDDVDLWVGGLAENDVPGAMVGPLFFEILTTQFAALRDGDRFWYQNVLTPEERKLVENTLLGDIIRRNTEISDEVDRDVFRVAGIDRARGNRRGR